MQMNCYDDWNPVGGAERKQFCSNELGSLEGKARFMYNHSSNHRN